MAPQHVVFDIQAPIASGGWRPLGKNTFRLEWIPWIPKGPRKKTAPELERIKKRLVEIGEASPGMSVADQAKRVGTSKRSMDRFLASRKSTGA
jgi:hypothetical protein